VVPGDWLARFNKVHLQPTISTAPARPLTRRWSKRRRGYERSRFIWRAGGIRPAWPVAGLGHLDAPRGARRDHLQAAGPCCHQRLVAAVLERVLTKGATSAVVLWAAVTATWSSPDPVFRRFCDGLFGR
jgi:hypothetical protein